MVKFKYFKTGESDQIATLPNAMTGIRGVGGLVIGSLMLRHGIDPSVAAGSVVGAGLLDAEGTVIEFFNKHPRLHGIQKKLRVIPSKWGRNADPIADKMFIVGLMIGGLFGHYLPPMDAVPIVATEAAITGVSALELKNGHEVRVNRWGKGGLLARGAALCIDLVANALQGSAHDIVQMSGHGLTASAVAMAGLNIATILRENHGQQSPPPETEYLAA